MEQITSTVQQNADHAAQANTRLLSASEAAREGGCAVERVVSTMGDISRSSQKIADITSTDAWLRHRLRGHMTTLRGVTIGGCRLFTRKPDARWRRRIAARRRKCCSPTAASVSR
jgi:hypothetical protein